MSLDASAIHDLPLGKMGIFGMPYHGLVQGGSMTLPNATTKTYPQPNADWPDAAGTTHLVAVPGVPSVVRTTAQAAADTAAGHQWRNAAMLSGGEQQLYGRNLNGWIYIDPAGARWHMEFSAYLPTATFDVALALNVTLTATRFGVFGGVLETHTYPLSLADWGQQGYPAQEGFPQTGGGFESITHCSLLMDAIYSNGSKVALLVHHKRLSGAPGTGDTTVDLMVRHPMGWLELALSGPGSALAVGLTVLKNRSQVATITTQTVSAMPDQVTFPALNGRTAPTIYQVRVGSQNFELDFSRLVSVRPDELTGGWKWISYRVKHRGTVNASLTESGNSYLRAFARSADFDMAMEIDGAPQFTYSIHTESSTSGEYEYLATPDASGKVFYAYDFGGTGITTIDGVTTSATIPASATTGLDSGAISTSPVLMSAGGALYNGTDLTGFVFRSGWRLTVQDLPLYGLPIGTPRFDFCRYSGQVFGFRAHINSTESRHSKQVSPAGVTAAGVTRTFSATERLYSSWCPHTGQVASLSTTPVCWV